MSSNDGNIVLGPGEGETIPVPGHTITHKLRGEDTVLEGEIKILMGEQFINAKAGSFVFIPKGMVHAMCLVGQNPAKFLATYSPAGMEKFFDEAAGLELTDTEAYVAKANALAEKYNMEIVGPPLEV